MKYSISAVTDVGMIRQNNEDMFLIAGDEVIMGEGDHCEVQSEGEGDFLVAIADGIGGAPAGLFAARRVLEIINEIYQEREPGTPLLEVIQFAFTRADEAIKKETEDDPDLRGAGATVAVIACRGDEAIIVQMSDTSVFIGRQGEWIDLFGHGLNRFCSTGIFCGPPDRGGKGKEIEMYSMGYQVGFSAASFHFKPGDSVLLLTDGFAATFLTEEISEIINGADDVDVLRQLCLASNSRNGTDNGTAVFCRLGETQGNVPSIEPLVGSFRMLGFEYENETNGQFWATLRVNGAIHQGNLKDAETLARSVPQHLGQEELLHCVEEAKKRTGLNPFRWFQR